MNSDCGGELRDVSRSVPLRAQSGERSFRFEPGGGEDERHGGRVDAVAGGYVGEVPGASIGARAVAEEGRRLLLAALLACPGLRYCQSEGDVRGDAGVEARNWRGHH